MAFFGLSKPWIAKLNTATDTYSDAMNVGEAVSTSVTPNVTNGALYGDNRLVESVAEFTNASVALGVTRMPAKAAEMMFGHSVSEEGVETSNAGDSAPFLGYGFITAEMVDGVKKYRACILHKVQFSEGEESYETKGDAVNFVTPSLNGTAVANNSGVWRTKSAALDSESAADAWIKEKFGVSDDSSSGS